MPAGTVYEEHFRVLWFDDADTPTDLEAITVTELADAFDTTGYLTEFDHGGSNDRVADGDYLQRFKPESMGTYGNQPKATFRRQLKGTGDEVAYTTFVLGALGTIVVFETLPLGADPGVGDSYKAYPQCDTGEPQEMSPAHNEPVRFTVEWACGSKPVRGVVTAS
jgi:hypothetical protein